MRILIGMAAIGLALSAKSANTWWVDDDNYGLSGLDGKTEQTAYGTIRDALNDADFATVTVDGVSTTYAAGTHEQRFDVMAANDVRIACTAGSVTVDRFRNELGALLLVR